MSVIIFATSAAGKSHFSNNSYGPMGIRVVDGDDTIASLKLWPKEKGWWKLPNANEVHQKHAEALVNAHARNRDLVMVFNGKMSVILSLAKLTKVPIDFFYVQVTLAQLKRNWQLREAAVKAGRSGHSSRPWEEYEKGWWKQGQVAAVLKIPVFDSFKAVADHLGLYMKAGYLK